MFMKHLSWRLGVIAALLVVSGLCAEVKLDDCFGDNMELLIFHSFMELVPFVIRRKFS